jgi:hypothetical protein
LSINDGLDEVVRRGVATAGTAAAVTGDILQKVRRAITVVQSNGYAPDTLAIDPGGAENLDLLRSSGSEQFYLYGPGQGAPGGPFGMRLRVGSRPAPRSSTRRLSGGSTRARSS